MNFAVKCWCCGKEAGVSGPAPLMGFHLLEAANAAGFIGILDHHGGRSLVFCSDDCLQKCVTKKGNIRFRPPTARRSDCDTGEKEAVNV